MIKKAYGAAILHACFTGFSFLFVKLALGASGPLDVLAHRYGVALIAAAVPLLIGKVKVKISIRECLWVVVLSIFYPILFFSLQTFGLQFASSSEAGIIQSTVPIFTLLLAYLLLKERPTGLQMVFVCLSISGVLFVSIIKGLDIGGDLRGILLLLSATLSLACYNAFTRKLAKRYTTYTLTFIMTSLGFIVFTTIALVGHGVNGSLSSFVSPLAKPSYIVSVVYLGLCCSFGTSFLSNFALSHIQASKMSVFSNFATVVSIIAGAIILSEPLRWYHIVGAAMIIAGVLGTNYVPVAKQPQDTADSASPTQ